MNLIDFLPNELLTMIFKDLSIGHLIIMRIVSKKWKDLIDFLIGLPKIKNDLVMKFIIHRETIDLTSLVEANDIIIIKKVIDKLHKDTIASMMRKSAETGSLEILCFLHSTHHTILESTKNDLIQVAGTNGQFHILKWLHEIKIPINDIYYYAIRYGNIEMLEWAHQNKYFFNILKTSIKPERNLMNLLLWLQKRHMIIEPLPEYLEIIKLWKKYCYDMSLINEIHYKIGTDEVFAIGISCMIFAKFYEKASVNHDLDILKWFKDVYGLVTPIGYIGAINGGHLDVLNWLYENDCHYIPSNVLEYAVKMNRMDMVEWFENHGVPNQVTINKAIEYGNLDFVKREVRNGITINHEILVASLFHDEIFDFLVCVVNDKSKMHQMMSKIIDSDMHHIVIDQYMRRLDSKYSWDQGKSHFENASYNGMFSYLKWLCGESPKNIDTKNLLFNAVQINHEPMIDWLLENGFYDKKDDRLYSEAISSGSLNLFQKLRKYGCQWNPAVCADAAYNGEFAILKWAHENGCPWDERTCIDAAMQGYLDILIWARENDCPWNDSVLTRAFENGHYYVLHWALNNGCNPEPILLAKAAHDHNDQLIKLIQKCKSDACTFTKYHSKYTLEWLVKHDFAPESIFTERTEFCQMLSPYMGNLSESDFSSFIDYNFDEMPTDEDILKRFHIKLE